MPRAVMTTKFINTLVLTVSEQRKLAGPLRAEQLEFLAALTVSADVFISPLTGSAHEPQRNCPESALICCGKYVPILGTTPLVFGAHDAQF